MGNILSRHSIEECRKEEECGIHDYGINLNKYFVHLADKVVVHKQ
jgi:hypothetical protein